MTDVEHAKKYAEESISLAISMYNPKAEMIAETACLYGLTYNKEQIDTLSKHILELQKDKGELIDQLHELKETLAQTIENDEVAYETLRLHDEEEIAMLNSRVSELEAQIEKMKCGQNCKHSYLYQEDRKCKFTYCDCINCKDKWELRR